MRRILECSLDRMRLRGILERELLDFLARILHQLERKLLRAVFAQSVDAPVLACLERGDFLLTFADEAQCGALHASCRQAAPDFLPQQRREIEADQIVQRTSRLLSIDQIFRKLARCADRRAYAVARDLVERHTVDLFVSQVAALPEYLEQMPGDRL